MDISEGGVFDATDKLMDFIIPEKGNDLISVYGNFPIDERNITSFSNNEVDERYITSFSYWEQLKNKFRSLSLSGKALSFILPLVAIPIAVEVGKTIAKKVKEKRK